MARSAARRTRTKITREVPSTQRLVLDSSAVIAWARGEARVRALITRAVELGLDIRIPVSVLAETLRGGARDAPVHRVRKAVDVFATDESVGRLAGELLGRAGRDNTIDAMVVAEAIHVGGAIILTSDVDDLRPLIGTRADVVVHPL